jgi:hypothetical protein
VDGTLERTHFAFLGNRSCSNKSHSMSIKNISPVFDPLRVNMNSTFGSNMTELSEKSG